MSKLTGDTTVILVVNSWSELDGCSYETDKSFSKAYYRILKLARTIADFAENENIKYRHLTEALQYRLKLMLG